MTRGPSGRLVAAVAALALCAGCTATSSVPPARAASTGARSAAGTPLAPSDGGSVTVAVDGVPTTLNDHTAAGDTAAARAAASMVWGQVFQVAPKVAPTLDTDVVTSAEVVSVQPQTVVYNLDPRAVWSDGTPVSAQDFVYSWLSQAGGGRDVDGAVDSVASTDGYRDIASVVGADGGKTITVVFRTPFADWESLFADLLPAHVAERAGWNHGFDRFDPAVLLSAGPFVVTSWTPGVQMTFGRNPRWWGTPARLDQVVIRTVPGAPAMAAALGSGQAQVAYAGAFDASTEAQVSSSPALQSSTSLGAASLQLVFGVHRSAVATPEVRRGIAHAVDRVGLVQTFVQPLAPLAWVDNDHLFTNMEPWYADDGGDYQGPDPVAGSRELVAGGLVQDATGTWTSHGAPVVLLFVWASDDPWSAVVGPAIAAQLVAAGFEVESAPTSEAQLLGSVLPNGAFDLSLAPVDTGAYPTTLSHVFGTPAGVPASSRHDWSGFDDPRVDALFAQASHELAAAQARALYQQADVALWDAMPTLPLFAEPVLMSADITLTGIRPDPGGLGPLWGIQRWAKLQPVPAANGAPGASRRS